MNTIHEKMTTGSPRERFHQLIRDFGSYIPQQDLRFTSDVEYAEILQSILDHKYLTNQKIPFEITMEQALFSWHENVYYPLIHAIEEAGLEWSFPDATRGELLLWVSRHWHFLKQEKGSSISAEEAVHSYGSRFGTGVFNRWLFRLRQFAA